MAPNNVDQVLGLEIAQRTKMLTTMPESQWFDRKAVGIKPVDLAKTLVAMANAEGGVVVVGIKNRQVEDLTEAGKLFNRLRLTPSADFCLPALAPGVCEVSEVAVLDQSGRTQYLLLFTIRPGKTVYFTRDQRCYLRTGDSNLELKTREVSQLEYLRGVKDFESEYLDSAKLSDLDDPALQTFYQRSGASRGVQHLLKSRGLLGDNGEITRAAYLLFNQNPTRFFPGASVRVCRYLGTERKSGTAQNLVFDRRAECSIPGAISQAISWVEEQLPTRKALRGQLFTQIPLLPKGAWVEGIVNAVIHRSYSLVNDHIRVEIFEDRMEISNPGRFQHPELLKNPLQITRYPQNPRIARTCTDLGYAQELGEGIKRIFADMREEGLEDPIYEQKDLHVILTLPFISRLSEDEVSFISPQGKLILQALRKVGGTAGTGELAAQTELSKPTVREVLKRLEQAELVAWRGRSPRDPRATWVLRGR